MLMSWNPRLNFSVLSNTNSHVDQLQTFRRQIHAKHIDRLLEAFPASKMYELYR